jgi:tetratricopeptide (TPR) repeat protein
VKPLRGKASVLFFLVSVLVFLGALFIVYRGVMGFRESRILDDILTRVDGRLEQELYEDIPELLDEASGVVSTPRNALRVLKRSYRLAEATEAYDRLQERAEAWYRRFPRDSEITAVAVYSFLESREAGAFRTPPEDRFLDTYPYLGAAYLLRTGAEVERTDHPYDLLFLGEASPPQVFFDAARVTNRSEYAIDGVLQLASSGFVRDSLREGEERSLSEVEPLLVATLAYDVGEWNRAAELLAPIPGNDGASLALRADAMYLAGRVETARQGYEALFRRGGDYAPFAYNNAALLAADRDKRVEILREGLATHPGDGTLVAALLEYEGRGGVESHLATLGREMARSPGGRDRLVFYLLTEADSREPEANAAQLWSLANAYPTDMTLRRYLLWYLEGIGRLAETERLVTGTETGVSSSLVFYRALYHNSRDRSEEAFLDFRRAHQSLFGWEAAHNAAVLALGLGRFAEAIELLKDAQGEPWYDLTDRRRSVLKVLEARVLLRQGDRQGARQRLREALAMSPGNTEAVRLFAAMEDQ